MATLFLKEIFKNMQTLRHINQLEVKQYSWHKVCGSFFFVINARPHRFSAFPVFHSTFDLISDSASKNEKAWYR